MDYPLYLLLPLVAGGGYALAALVLKRAMAFGVGPWRITFFSNCGLALAALPLLLFPSEGSGEIIWYLPVIAAVTFLGGQIFTFLALFKGDVSVATPLMGSKILFVAFLTVLMLGESLPLLWWISAGLATAALALLGGGRVPVKGKFWPTVFFSLASAFLFALTDIFMQEWGPSWGFTRFMPVMFGMVAVYSLVFIPFFKNRLFSVAPGAWPWLVGGSLLLGFQALTMASGLVLFGHATAMNIAYSGRGVWSVLLVWGVGHWFGNEERTLGRNVMTRRLVGAGVLAVAVVLVVFA